MKVKLSYYLILLLSIFCNFFMLNKANAQATVNLSVSPSSRSESVNVAVAIEATLSETQTLPVTVYLSFSGTATNGVDYTLSSENIVINPGELSGSISLNNISDVLNEGNETVIIDILDITNASENGNQQKTYTIIDSNNTPTVELILKDIYNPIVDENAGEAYVVAEIREPSQFTVTVPLQFSGTATGNGTDYTTSSNAIIIPAGKLKDSLKITAVPDGILEGDETVVMEMLPPIHTLENEGSPVKLTIEKIEGGYKVTTSIEGIIQAEEIVAMDFEYSIHAIKDGFQQETLIITDNGITPPEGYAVSIDQDPINEDNESNVSFTFANATIGSAYNYTFSSSGGGTPINGTGVITEENQQITGVDLSGLPVGIITLSATLTNDIGIAGAPATDTANKIKALSITANTGQAKVYGDPDPVFTYTATGFDGNDDVSILTGALTRTPGETIGSYPILIGTLSAGPYYTIDYTGADFIISNNLLTVVADANQAKVYGDSDPTFTYTVAGFMGTDDKSILTGSLTRTSGENVGTYPIQLGTLSATGYDINFITETFEITHKDLNIIADSNQSKVYGDSDPELTYSVNGFVNSDDASLLTGNLTREIGENVGNYNILQGTVTAGNNYTISYSGSVFNISPRNIIITTHSGQNKQYGNPEPTLTYTVENLAENDTESILSGNLTRTNGEAIGSYPITQGTLTTNSNYIIDFKGADFYITQRILTISADSNQSKVYGEEDPEFSYSVNGLTPTEDTSILSGKLTRETGENVGSYAILQGDLTANDNYLINFSENTFKITPAYINPAPPTPSIIFNNKTFVFNGSPKSIFINGTIPVGTSVIYINNEQINVGAHEVKAIITGPNHYDLELTAELTITPKELNITADNGQNKMYGQKDPIFTYTATGFEGTDDESIITGTLSRATGETIGSYPIELGALGAGSNYSITFNDASFEIIKADQLITWDQELIFGCDSNSELALTATSSSGLPVSYSSTNNNVASISNNILVKNTSGTASITVSQEGNENYNPATVIVKPIIINTPGLISQYWEDVLVFDNSSKQYVSYQWFKNGVAIDGATKQYYSENNPLNGIYHAEAIDVNGNTIITCPLEIDGGDFSRKVKIIPNPVDASSQFTVQCSFEESVLNGAVIHIFDLNARLLQTVAVTGTRTQLTAPREIGMYIVSVTFTNGKRKTANLVVK